MTWWGIRHGRRIVARTLGKPAARLADVQASIRLAPLSPSYVPWSAIAMRPSGVTAVLDDIALRSRSTIVECGAGITTVYIARLLSARGGHLWSIEHDASWAALVDRELARNGLRDQVTMVIAPLEASGTGNDGLPWYSRVVLEEALEGLRIDLLIVDGPPAWDREIRMARYPALGFFRSRMAADWTIVLDDIRRPGEEAVAGRWERELGIPFDRRFIRGGIAVAHSQAGPHG